jgi:hypothetical protein
MAINVNLDAHIPREDFEVIADGDAPVKQSIDIKDLEHDAFFYGALRKPDFQRETAEWDAQRVVGLIETFIKGELVPAVILWKNRELLFVIDGSHRLSALIAWVRDDYGDKDLSQQFFNHTVPEEQIKVATRTRELINTSIGSYAMHKDAIINPAAYGPDIVSRARALGSLPLQLQMVRGDSATAEAAFIRINRKAVNISPPELELIEKRKRPQTIAARAIIRRGTGHKYWSQFGEKEQRQIEEIATDLHGLIFAPELQYPIQSLDLPPGGAVYSGPALRMVYDFIALCVSTVSDEDDVDGQRTIRYLTRCRRVMQLILSKDASSLGLHPAIYLYSWTGNQQPILFLVVANLAIELDRANRLREFTKCRQALEEFLFVSRTLINQIIRKFGTKDSGFTHLTTFYNDLLELIEKGTEARDLADALRADPKYSYLQPAEIPYDGVSPTRMSTQVRAGLVMRKLLESAPRCSICGGFMPAQAISVDHKHRKQDGGLSTKDNTALAHPYCNTGYKESRHAKAKLKN